MIDLSAPLPTMDRAARLERVRAQLTAHDLDAMWVTTPVNVRWLTGFVASNAAVMVTLDDVVVATDDRYRTQLAADLERFGLAELVTPVMAPNFEPAFAGLDGTTIGVEADHLTMAARAQLDQWVDATIEPTNGSVAGLRQVKEPAEVARLERAAAIADVALAELFATVEVGDTERDLARRIERHMLDLGAEDRSYETIVATGPNAALPHARPSGRAIEAGDFLLIDVGAKVDGYGSDMTRTIVVGAEPTDEQRRWWHAVEAAQAAGVALVAAGVEVLAVDQRCREVLAEHDLAEAFIHGTGHGIGLEIHEQPIVSPRSVGILPAGLVVTVEPGVYLPGQGGVRIEDSVVVTDDGCRPITRSPKTITPPA